MNRRVLRSVVFPAAVVVAGCDIAPLERVRPASLGGALADEFTLAQHDSLVSGVASAALPEELSRFAQECHDVDTNDGTDLRAPTPPSLPTFDALPAACDEEARIAQLTERCGPLSSPVVVTASLADALAQCDSIGTTCQVEVPPGDFNGGADLGCALVTGAGDQTRIHGALHVHGDSIIRRLSVDDGYGAVDAAASALLSDVTLRGGYSGLSVAWDADVDVALCRSRVAAGYSGAGQSWNSRKLTVAGSAIAACYEGVSSSWGSAEMHVQGNVILGGFVGVSVHHARESNIVDNALFGGTDAVGISQFDDVVGSDAYTPRVEGVLIDHNDILGGALPASDAARDIVVQAP